MLAVVLNGAIKSQLANKNYSSVVNYLKEAFTLIKDENGKLVKYEFSLPVIETLMTILNTLPKCPESDIVLIEVFKSFRNYVINSTVQKHLANNIPFLNSLVNYLETEVSPNLLKVILQLLINLVISNKCGAVNIYKLCFKTICSYLHKKVNIYEVSALIYNISLHHKLEFNYDVYSSIIDCYKSESNIEFIRFLIEKFIGDDEFWHYYEQFELDYRIIILESIRNIQIRGDALELAKTAIDKFLKIFMNSGNIICQTVFCVESNLQPYEISLVLQILTSLCGSESYLNILQQSKDLLINSAVLLINIHRLGKESENCFSSIQKLSDLRNPNNEIAEHPAFGFKADLIRLIANLCWKNKLMQDLARDAEVIPVILDCCNMDARNPFIIQWVILAIRNLCEGNLENQKIIAGMHQQGVISSSVLDEFGLTLQGDNNNPISIVSLDALKSSKL